jgi:hypothetical protein
MSGGRCNATIKYNIPNSDNSPNWRTQTCSLFTNDAGTAHDRDGGTTHEGSGNVRWDAPIGSNTELPDGQLPSGA